uniref:Protein kinase ATM/Tel1 n=1 Tax=Cyriopagopus schmidti TaxID=29017 RepID=B5M6G7_CYRSC|nr:protein kinase ATM/Tel1 [Cyriopagopus schmidti]
MGIAVPDHLSLRIAGLMVAMGHSVSHGTSMKCTARAVLVMKTSYVVLLTVVRVFEDSQLYNFKFSMGTLVVDKSPTSCFNDDGS